MNGAALSMLVFGIYMVVSGIGFTVVPNAMLGLFGMPATTEPWIRILGWVMVVLGYYYIQVGRHGFRAFFLWSVYARTSVAIVFLYFVLVGWAPATLLLFGALDLAGAIWTSLALRAEARQGVALEG